MRCGKDLDRRVPTGRASSSAPIRDVQQTRLRHRGAHAAEHQRLGAPSRRGTMPRSASASGRPVVGGPRPGAPTPRPTISWSSSPRIVARSTFTCRVPYMFPWRRGESMTDCACLGRSPPDASGVVWPCARDSALHGLPEGVPVHELRCIERVRTDSPPRRLHSFALTGAPLACHMVASGRLVFGSGSWAAWSADRRADTSLFHVKQLTAPSGPDHTRRPGTFSP